MDISEFNYYNNLKKSTCKGCFRNKNHRARIFAKYEKSPAVTQ